MDYNNKKEINNLIDYSKESNKYIPYENTSKNIISYYNNKIAKNSILKRYLKKKSYNINERNLMNEIKPFSSRGNIKTKNDIYSFKHFEYKRINKTPQARKNIRESLYYTDQFNNENNMQHNNDYLDFNDIRVDFCLEMLNLNNIKNIFHKRNIRFEEMLYLSQKDMTKMGIPTYSQLIIQKFTKDYLAKASYYTAEELEKFFQIYYSFNIKKIVANKKIKGEFPIRSFSPIAYNTKSLLNKYNYELFNINNFTNNNNHEYTNYYNKINNNIYNNNNFNTNINQRNCLSATNRRKKQIINRKDNKNIRFSSNSNLYPNHKRFRNISSSNSQNFMNSSPINYNNYLIDDYTEVENNNITNISNINKRNYTNKNNKNNINNKITRSNKKIENYLNNMNQPRKKEGNFEVLNLAINNFYKENMKKEKEKEKNSIRKMNQNNPNKKLISKKMMETKENKHFNSFENIANSRDNYFHKVNNINNNIKNQKKQTFTSKNNNLLNSYNISSQYNNNFLKQNNKKSSNQPQYKHSIINNYKNFINNKMKNKTENNNTNNNGRKTINTSIIYKPNNNIQHLISNSNNKNVNFPLNENSINLISLILKLSQHYKNIFGLICKLTNFLLLQFILIYK